jgi:hypothetical protein
MAAACTKRPHVESVRRVIPAKFLLASPPPVNVEIPADFIIRKVPAKVAAGSRNPRWSGSAGPMSSREHGALYHGAKR